MNFTCIGRINYGWFKAYEMAKIFVFWCVKLLQTHMYTFPSFSSPNGICLQLPAATPAVWHISVLFTNHNHKVTHHWTSYFQQEFLCKFVSCSPLHVLSVGFYHLGKFILPLKHIHTCRCVCSLLVIGTSYFLPALSDPDLCTKRIRILYHYIALHQNNLLLCHVEADVALMQSCLPILICHWGIPNSHLLILMGFLFHLIATFCLMMNCCHIQASE